MSYKPNNKYNVVFRCTPFERRLLNEVSKKTGLKMSVVIRAILFESGPDYLVPYIISCHRETLKQYEDD
jgi:hypothetical protein